MMTRLLLATLGVGAAAIALAAGAPIGSVVIGLLILLCPLAVFSLVERSETPDGSSHLRPAGSPEGQIPPQVSGRS